MPPTIRQIKEASEWYYFGRNYCFPQFNQIGLSPTPLSLKNKEAVYAAAVFAALKLSTDDLNSIFLRNYCKLNNSGAWQLLTNLTGKTIHVMYHQIPGEKRKPARHVATYYPCQ